MEHRPLNNILIKGMVKKMCVIPIYLHTGENYKKG